MELFRPRTTPKLGAFPALLTFRCGNCGEVTTVEAPTTGDGEGPRKDEDQVERGYTRPVAIPEPWCDMSADDHPDGNERKDARHRTLKGARIVFGDGNQVFECLVRNLSATGALLFMSSTLGIPNRFQLLLDDKSPPRVCEVVWRDETEIGIRFVNSGAPEAK